MPDGGADVSRRVVRGVLFDIDDTLVDTRSAFAAALAEVAAEFLPGVPAADYPRLLATWRADTGRYYRAFTRGEIGHLDQRRARVDQLHEVYDGSVLDDATFLRWNERYDAAFERAWTAFDDAVPAVTAAREAGLRTGSLTNALAAMQRVKLVATGLDDLAPLLVSLDNFGVGKPDRRVFLEACRLLGTAPEETIYVGDELDTDARGAQHAGLHGVWLDRPGRRRGAPHDEDPAAAAADGIAVIGGLDALASVRLALG
ncbi:HAD family hydrolase [Occultella glacieicola]|uniref:HAD family hydrolase n=1 Tax=Occultella glacieicola TaxID=2518684 RepID=A0ABY2E5S2_9MICO|nr:HAD family hydrolase [Occultella glacieicola]TDE95809.1 HAD family hydrolase [Occultella glacieicola]